MGPASATRTRITFALRAIFSVSLLVLLAWQLQRSAGGIELVSPLWLVAAAALVPVAVGVRVASFMILVNRDGRVLGPAQATYLTLVGAGAGLFLPGGAGDLLKAALGARSYGSAEKIVSSSVIDKLTSLVAVAAMGAVGALAAGEPALAAMSAIVLIIALVPLVAPHVVPWRIVVRILGGRDLAPARLQQATVTPARVLLSVIAVSLIGWLVTYTVVLACCRAAGADVGASYIYSMAPLITLTGLIPISLAGLGLAQVTMSALLVRAGVPQSIAISAAFFQLVVNLAPGVVGIVLYGLRGAARQR